MTSNQRNMIILFITIVVMMIGFGIIIPILPFYIEWLGASGRELGLLMGAFSLTQLICSPFWGGLSDRIGRKPVLMLGIFGNALAMLLMGLSTTLWMLFTARVLVGILSSASLPTAMAYISDSTAEENRGGGMGALGAAMGVGMVLGPGLGGWLARTSLSTPFFVAAGLSLLVLTFVFFVLPESLPPERRSWATGKLRGPNFKQMWQSLFGPLGFLMFLSFLVTFGLTNFEAIFGLYALEQFKYGPEQVGMILVSIGITAVLVQGLLAGPLTRRWGESRVIQGALLLSAIGFVVMLTAFDFTTVLLTTSFFMIGNTLLRPATAALISKRSDKQEQGAVLGLHNSFMSMGRIAGPMWAGFVFDYNLSLPYLSGAVIMIVGLLTTFIWLTGKSKPQLELESVSESQI